MSDNKIDKAKDRAWLALLDEIEKLPSEPQTTAQREWVLEGKLMPRQKAAQLLEQVKKGEIEERDMLVQLHDLTRQWKQLGKYRVECEPCGISMVWTTPAFFCPRCGCCRSEEAVPHNPVDLQELGRMASLLEVLGGFWWPWRWRRVSAAICHLRNWMKKIGSKVPGDPPNDNPRL